MTEKAAGEKQAPRLARLAETIGATKTRGPAPVELWNPPYCGDIDLLIAADGTWFYEGTPINRPALVSLFAGILRKDADRFVLVTPVERLGIKVEDAPFVAVALAEDDHRLRCATNLGDEVEIGDDHPLRFSVAPDGGVKPYVRIRGDLWARFTRGLSIDLLDRTVTEDVEGRPTVGIRSGRHFYALGPADELDG